MRAAYRHAGPPKLTLFTMKNVQSGNGAHTGLMVNASQRVIFDPAGTFGHETVPERNDVHFGITPRIEEFYISYHARETYFVVRQDLEVSGEAAELALHLVQQAGPVPSAQCTTATARVLRRLPGLGHIRVSLFPDNLKRQFGALSGVTETEFREDDSDDKSLAAAAFDAELSAELSSASN